jgi:hypothetical protein
MAGGITGWVDEGFNLVTGFASTQARQLAEADMEQ